VGRTDQPLLAQIDRDALDDRVPLATTLRKCVALGAQARNDELRDWASKELGGYRDGDVPSYRTIHEPLLIDGVTATHQVRGQQVSTIDLPDFARDVVTEELPLATASEIYRLLCAMRQRPARRLSRWPRTAPPIW
jgi:hypothetical protein